jgi:tetratricopeptide (TPR) repeat protein
MPTPIYLIVVFLALLAPQTAHASEAEWLLARGQAALGEGANGKAYDLFEDGLKKSPADLRFAYLAGVAAGRNGNSERALELFKLVETPEGRKAFPDLDLAVGRVLFSMGDYENAKKRITAYVSANPDDAVGFVWLAETNLRMGKDEEAFLAFSRAGKPEPKFRPVYHFTRGTRIFLVNPNEASEELAKAIDADRDGRIGNRAKEFISLAQAKGELERWYNIDVALGVQNDDNMLLNTKADGTLRYSGQRAVLSAAAYARPKVGDRFYIGFGANLNEAQTVAVDPKGKLKNGLAPEYESAFFNIGSHTLFADGAYYIPYETFSLEPGAELSMHYGRLGGETHDLTFSFYPRLMWYHSAKSAAKVYAITQLQSLSDIDVLAPQASDRSGLLLGGGVAEYLVFDSRLDAVSVFAEFVMKSTDSGGEDYAGPRAGVNGRKRIVADLYVDAGAFVSQRSYSGGNARPSELLLGADGGFGYLLFNRFEIDLNAGYITNQSEDDYAYDRLVTGVFFRGLF